MNNLLNRTPINALLGRYDHSYNQNLDEEFRRSGLPAELQITPVPFYVPPQAFRDPIYVQPPPGPARQKGFGLGLELEDKPSYWERMSEPMLRGYR